MIPLGIDPRRMPEPTDKQKSWAGRVWGEGYTRILSVGRLTYYKGHEVLLQAVANLPEVRLLVVGEGNQRRRLESLMARLGLGPRASLLGWRSEAELNALFATCDVFCLPSIERTEAFGLVLLEAMRFSKPIVASDIPGSGVSWVVRHNETGILVPPRDSWRLAQSLRQIGRDPIGRERSGQAGSERFRKLFHIEHVAKRIVSLYYEVLQAG